MPGFDISQMNSPLGPVLSSACHDGAVPYPQKYLPQPTNTTETARRYRYRFETLEPLDQESLLVYAYKTTRPSVEIDQIVIHNGQDEIYRPGKNRWLPIDITFYERIFGETGEDAMITGGYDQPAELIYKWWSETMININKSLHGLIWDSTSGVKGYRKPCQLTMLDGLGSSVWAYYLANCWPMKVTPCELGYADTEIADITVTLAYDKAMEMRL